MATLLCAALALSLAHAAHAQPAAPRDLKPKLAVLGLDAPELDEQLRAGLEALIGREAQLVSAHEVVTSEDLRAVLSLAQHQQLVGCVAQECADQFAAMLSAQQLISGSVHLAEGQYLITLQRLDLVNGRSLGRATSQVEKSSAALIKRVRGMVPELFGVVGRVVLWDQPAGAEVFLDGMLVGRTPVEAIVVKRAGKHTISVLGPGLTPWQTEVELQAGAEARVRALNQSVAELEQEADARSAWGLGLVGAGVTALLGGGTLLGLAYLNDARLDRLDLRRTSQAELDAITNQTLTLVVGASALGLAGAAGLGSGAFMLIHNPARSTLVDHGY